MIFEQFQIFKKIKKLFLPHVLLGPDVYAVTDPIVKRMQMRQQEQSLPVMKEKMPDLSLPMRKQTKRQQVPVMKKRNWLLVLRVMDVLAVGEGGHRRRRVGWMK